MTQKNTYNGMHKGFPMIASITKCKFCIPLTLHAKVPRSTGLPKIQTTQRLTVTQMKDYRYKNSKPTKKIKFISTFQSFKIYIGF